MNLKSILLREYSNKTINRVIFRSSEDSTTAHHCPSNSIYTIGRLKFCDIIVNDASVSATHATIDVRENRVVITDSNSTNGTYVNNELIAQKKLAEGDVIKVGESKFIISFDMISKKVFNSLEKSTNTITIDLEEDYDNIINLYKNEYENHILLEVERQTLIFCQEFEQLFRSQEELIKKKSIINFMSFLSRPLRILSFPEVKAFSEKNDNIKSITADFVHRILNVIKEKKAGNIFCFEEIAADNPTEIQMNGIAVTRNNKVKLLIFGIPYDNLLYLVYASNWMSQFYADINETI